MEKRYLTTLINWSWMLVIAAVLAAATTYWTLKDQPSVYTAQSRLMVGPGIDDPYPDLNTLRAGGQLMQTYAELPTTTPFLESVMDELNIDMPLETLLDIIEIRASEVTQILQIRVKHGNPDLAIAIANAIAENLVKVSPSSPESSSNLIKDEIREQVAVTEDSIAMAEARIALIEAELEELRGPAPQQPWSLGTFGSGSTGEAKMKQFESRLQNAADLEAKRLSSIEILEELLWDTNIRIEKLESDLNNTTDVSIQRLLLAQLTKDRNQISSLRRILIETQRSIGGEPLEKLIATSEASVNELERELASTIYIETRKLLMSQLDAERDRLSELRAIEVSREGKVLEQIAQERTRLSEIQQVEVEKQQIFLGQLAEERRSQEELRRTLSLLYTSLQEAPTNQVRIIEVARHAQAVPSLWLMYVLVSGAAGLILSILAVMVVEYLDDTIKTTDDLAQLTNGPVLGIISRHKRLLNTDAGQLVVEQWPSSKAAEDYRMLGAKLFLTNDAQPVQSVILTGIQKEESALEAAANLADVLSQTGNKVYLIDANVNQSTIERYFRFDEQLTLAEILSGGPIIKPLNGVPTEYPNLYIIPAGSTTKDTFKMIASSRMLEVVDNLKQRGDIVLIAAPPLLSSAETLFLSSRVDGVVLVTYASQTHRKNIHKAVDSLRSVGVNFLGSILSYNRAGNIIWKKNQVGPGQPIGKSISDKLRKRGVLPSQQDPRTENL